MVQELPDSSDNLFILNGFHLDFQENLQQIIWLSN